MTNRAIELEIAALEERYFFYEAQLPFCIERNVVMYRRKMAAISARIAELESQLTAEAA